ncbi:MAG TPA: hypothetical protein VGK67_07975 [Myxococcales bacterium]|jgi:hypothetical protein
MKSFAAAVIVLSAVALAGCATLNREQNSHMVGKPLVDRCAKQQIRPQKACERERDVAVEFARKLSIDDQVCIDGKQRIEEPMVNCKVRAFVSSAGKDGVKLDIREAPGGSKYVVGSSWWFAEEALADVDLHAQGYLLNEEIAAEDKQP